MVSDAGVKIKIMPDSPEADLEKIESDAKSVIESKEGKVVSVEKEPVAFGLNSLTIMFTILETFEQDPITKALQEIEHVSSAEIVDFRRIGF